MYIKKIISISIQTLYSSTLLKHLWHLYLRSYSHYFLQIVSSNSVWLVGERRCTTIFRLSIYLGFIRPEKLVSHGLSPLGAFWQTPSGLSCAFYWGTATIWPLYHKLLIGGVLQRWLSFWKILHIGTPELSEWPSDSWSPPWPRPFSPVCSVWLGGKL